jgi:hypothetical protein
MNGNWEVAKLTSRGDNCSTIWEALMPSVSVASPALNSILRRSMSAYFSVVVLVSVSCVGVCPVALNIWLALRFFWLFVTAHQAQESAKTAEMEIQMSSKIDNGKKETSDSS